MKKEKDIVLSKGDRLFQLETLLKDSDFKFLGDYDEDVTALKDQRAAWRAEIRELKE